MKIENLTALVPGQLELLQHSMNARLPTLAGLPDQAILFRNVAGASAVISAFSAFVTTNFEDESAKALRPP